MTFPLAIGWIGSGQMATALAKAWLKADLASSKKSLASDPFAAARVAFASVTNLKVTESNAEVVEKADVVVLAVKPQSIPAVLAELKPLLKRKPLVISIAAGVTLQSLADGLGGDVAIIRAMPNTPCLVGASATGFAPNSHATQPQIEAAIKLFSAVGVAFPLPERLLDAVTGLSGSGPAYIYTLIEAMADGGVKMGLPRDVALKLATQTTFGAAKMLIETGQHPSILKDAVTSPGGTTIAGLHALEVGAFRGAVMNAVEAATKRATELGAQNAGK